MANPNQPGKGPVAASIAATVPVRPAPEPVFQSPPEVAQPKISEARQSTLAQHYTASASRAELLKHFEVNGPREEFEFLLGLAARLG